MLPKDALAVHQAEGVAGVAETGQQFVEEDVRAREQAEVLADQHLAPVAGDRAVELTDVDGGIGAVGLAVVDGHPEGSATTEAQLVDLPAEVEADVVRQESHLHPRLAAIVGLALAVDVAVDVEGIEVAVGGKGGLVLVVQQDIGGGRLQAAQGTQRGQGQRQDSANGGVVLVHGALREVKRPGRSWRSRLSKPGKPCHTLPWACFDASSWWAWVPLRKARAALLRR